ncbi:MAG: hypothetical protein EPN48_04440 [Microbacteriaceae bacterium]|nr:MAG: hypothetical protein EPN48_04440 [Microbacteriaceae bacterium]
MAIHQEVAFEAAIEADMLGAGWTKGFPADYDRELAIDAAQLLAFLEATQQHEWQRLEKIHESLVEQKIVERFATHVAGRMGGQAKAMVVTRSPLHAGVDPKAQAKLYPLLGPARGSWQSGLRARRGHGRVDTSGDDGSCSTSPTQRQSCRRARPRRVPHTRSKIAASP